MDKMRGNTLNLHMIKIFFQKIFFFKMRSACEVKNSKKLLKNKKISYVCTEIEEVKRQSVTGVPNRVEDSNHIEENGILAHLVPF